MMMMMMKMMMIILVGMSTKMMMMITMTDTLERTLVLRITLSNQLATIVSLGGIYANRYDTLTMDTVCSRLLVSVNRNLLIYIFYPHKTCLGFILESSCFM